MTTQDVKPGHLYVVATPIGNLGDLSPRALKVLDGVDLLAAEDTRVTAALLSHFGLRKRTLSLHEHNEAASAAAVLAELRRGRSAALVSDAGTPLLSDPGYTLVRDARAAQVPVIAVPGPSAAVAALSIAGLPTDSFLFAGFLPAKADARRQRLQELAANPATVVLYESTHRIVDSVAAIVEVAGAGRRLCLARELTKLFEESRTAPAGEVLDWLKADPDRQRGEFVLVLEGAPAADAQAQDAARVLRALLAELPPSRAAKVAAAITGQPRKALYEAAVQLGGGRAERGADE